jgi:hypothetical protein
VSVTFPVRHAHAHDPKTSLIRGDESRLTSQPSRLTSRPSRRAAPVQKPSTLNTVMSALRRCLLLWMLATCTALVQEEPRVIRRAALITPTNAPCTFPVRRVLLLRGGAPTTPPVASRKKESDTKEIMIAGVKLSNLPAALRAELMTHGLEYLSWMYTTVFTVFSLRMYCTACSDSRIKSAIPSLVVLALLWRLSDRTMSNFKSDPHASNDRPKIALEIRHHIVVALNIVGTIIIFGDLLWCFVKQLWRVSASGGL